MRLTLKRILALLSKCSPQMTGQIILFKTAWEARRTRKCKFVEVFKTLGDYDGCYNLNKYIYQTLRGTYQVIVPKMTHCARNKTYTQHRWKFSSGDGYPDTSLQEILSLIFSHCVNSLVAIPKHVLGKRQAPAFCDL